MKAFAMVVILISVSGLERGQSGSTRIPISDATLVPATDGTTIYDAANKVNWLADANLAATNRFGLPVCGNSSAQACINTSGSMSYQAAAAWVQAMNAARYLGHSNWQLPTTPSSDPNCPFKGTQGNSFGFGCSASAFGSLYYNALGLKAPNTAVPIPSSTTGPFINFQPYLYWSQDSASQNASGNATFSFNSGFHGANTAPNFLYVLPMIQGKIPGTPAAPGQGLQVSADKQTVYDPVANVTWAANANLPATNTFGLPACKDQTTPKLCVNADGAMDLDSANQFITNMNSGTGYLGQKNWQLPPLDPNCPNYNCTSGNPMGELFYGQLGSSQGTPVVATPAVAVGPFKHVQPYLYWACQAATVQSACQTEGPAPNFEWSFSFGNGFEGTDIFANDLYVTAYFVGDATSIPTPVISKVANAEGESATIAANTWVEIKGSNLAPAGDSRIWQGADFVNGQMPTALDGVSVTVNGKAAYVYFISATQVNILTPPDALTGAVQVTVTINGTASAPFTAQAQALSPSFFVFNDGQHVAAVHADGSLLGPASLSVPGYVFTPAKPGDTVQIYANGFGPTNVPVVSGSSSQSGTLSPLPVIKIGGITATVTYAGLVFPGEFQFNVVIPSDAPGGDQPITATYNGATTQAGTLITIAGSAPSTTVTYFVSPNGNDAWSGTLAAPNSSGTDGPFASFDHVRAAVRALNKTGLKQVAVQFRGGTYYLPQTVQFSAADSGSSNLAIIYQNYPGESPVFSGGIRLQNWTSAGGNSWKTTLPASTQYFENLFYNGTRRLRPRLGGYLGAYYRIAATVYLNAPGPPAKAPNDNCSVWIAGFGWECFDRFQYDPNDPISTTWKNLAPAGGNPCGQPAGNPSIAGDIEILDWEQFSTSKLRLSCVDPTNHIMYMTGATPISQNKPTQVGFIAGNRYLVDNVQDALTQPGQWFLDHSSTPWTLTYLANPGENPNTDLVIVPQLPQLLVASGLQYMTFQGLTFQHDNYTVPAAGHKSSELEADISAAVSFQNSQHITFDSGTVREISGTGLEFISCLNPASPEYCASNNLNAVTANNVVENSAFYDIGAVGVRIGDPYAPVDNAANVPQSIIVQNNVVEGYGRTIPASFGIGQGEGHDNLYTHNDVYDGYHCAISISEQAGDTTRPDGIGNANNTISFNHVYNLLQGIMNDGGAIRIEAGNNAYTAPGNKILNNKIHDVSDASALDSNGYGGNGIYLDNQTGLVDVENNLVYRVSANTVFTPQGPAAPNEANLIRNNILAYGRGGMVSINSPYPYGVPASTPQNLVITNNLFYFDRNNTSTPKFWVQGGCLYAGGAAYTQFQQWSSNMYWRSDGTFASDAKAFAIQPDAGTGPAAPCTGNTNQWTFYTFALWQQKAGEDLQSLVQNPGFANPVYPADDFSLPKGSPGVGFVMFDPSQAGRSNPVIKPPAVPATFLTKPFNPATDY